MLEAERAERRERKRLRKGKKMVGARGGRKEAVGKGEADGTRRIITRSLDEDYRRG